MSYPGYSEGEYASEVVTILHHKFGLSSDEAGKLLRDNPEIRYYYSGPRSPSPSALANRLAKEHHLKAKTKVGPPMETGYAYKYMGHGQWEDVVVSENVTDNARFEGFATIYGTRMAVWKSGRHSYAQTAVGPRHESHWTGKHGDKRGSRGGALKRRASRR